MTGYAGQLPFVFLECKKLTVVVPSQFSGVKKSIEKR
jgi:hypothetical protein